MDGDLVTTGDIVAPIPPLVKKILSPLGNMESLKLLFTALGKNAAMHII